jgi:hypothetical protein
MTIPQWGKAGRQAFWMRCAPSTRCAAALLIACVLAPSAASATCKCADVGSMLDRIAEAKTAIGAYQAAINGMTDAEKTEKMGGAGVKTGYSGKLQPFVQAALNGYRSTNPGFHSYASATDGACDIQVDPNATSCLGDALWIHERIHKKACDAHKRWIVIELITGQTDYKNDVTLKDIAQEEIAAYQAEIDFFNQQLGGAQQDCAKKAELSRYVSRDQRLAQRERVRRSVMRVSAYAASIS